MRASFPGSLLRDDNEQHRNDPMMFPTRVKATLSP
jgi:hypothetical protein